jgi:penicillin G amidase
MKRTSRILRNVVLILLGLMFVAYALVWWVIRRSLPTLDGSVTLPVLKQSVTVDRDQWGRPWIRANSLEDLVAAQGYVMAQDRLWQMDLLRRASAGELSEIFGDVAFEVDKENRTLGMRVAAERAAADSAPEIRGLLDAYASGVNQYIDRRAKRLPIEFLALGYKPRPWTAADTYLISLYMYKTLTSTWKEKLNRQWIVQKVGGDRARDLFVEDSPLDHFIVGGEAVGARSDAARRTTQTLTPLLPPGTYAPPFAPHEWNDAEAFLAQFDDESSEIIGSNNFVVSGAHTASGKPLLANDTHLGLGVPCIWYLVHLTAPGWNVEGFALPGAPMVIIGHSDRIAWGFTNSNADVQDLYAETFDPANALAYHVNGAWRTAEVRRETIHVRGKADVAMDVVVTRHGPIVYRETASEGGRAYALRWTALEPGGLDFGFPFLGRAKNWNEFIETTKHIAGPGQNTIYADVDGNIGFTIPARIPIRVNGNGALPVPGDNDDHEWKGYIPFDELPRALNPPEGIIATANARTVGPGYKYYLSDRQAGPYRTERIYELLLGRTGLTPADCNAVQNDVLSLPNRFLAQQIVAAARVAKAKNPRAEELIAKLDGWDAEARAASPETTFVEYTRNALFHNLLAPLLGARVTDYELWEPESVYGNVWWRDKVFLENVLRARPPVWLPKAYGTYDELIAASADQAATELEKETNSTDPTAWEWGRLHRLDMIHPLGRSGLLHTLLSIGPYPSNGTVDTVRAMGMGHGPSMRLVVDLANFDDSLMEITTGESGQFSSPYYKDEFPEWFAGRGIPAPFTDAAENAVRAHQLALVPAPAK